jgi:hypothetical protein
MMRWLKIDWSTFARTAHWIPLPPGACWLNDTGPLSKGTMLLLEAEARYRLGDRL